MGRFQNSVRSLTLKVFAKRKQRKTYDLGGEGGIVCLPEIHKRREALESNVSFVSMMNQIYDSE